MIVNIMRVMYSYYEGPLICLEVGRMSPPLRVLAIR